MGRPVVHFEILGEDGARLRAYYQALFGWSFCQSPVQGYGLVEGAGIGGGIGGFPGYPGHVTVYVEVPDVEAALASAEQLGGKRVMGPERVGDLVVIGQFTDPEGHLVGVVAAPPAEPPCPGQPTATARASRQPSRAPAAHTRRAER